MKNFMPLALLLIAVAPVAAQTARIAHLSHGGSLATLDAAADNEMILLDVPELLAAR